MGRSPGAAAAAAAAEDGARGARTWRPARGRGQGRLLRRAAAPRAGAAASMAPSPRTSSRQDATALPSMSSTFWAFMILASLLIAYCSEYRAVGHPNAPPPPAGPRGRPRPSSLARTPAGGSRAAQSLRGVAVSGRTVPRVPAGPPRGREGEGPPGLLALPHFGGRHSCPRLPPLTPEQGPGARPRVARRVPEQRCPRLPGALPPLRPRPAIRAEPTLPGRAPRSGGGSRSGEGGRHCWGVSGAPCPALPAGCTPARGGGAAAKEP